MSRPVLPEPAGASTINDVVISSAWRRSSASGGPVRSIAGGSAGKRPNCRTSATVHLQCGGVEEVDLGFGIEFEVGLVERIGIEHRGIEAAEHALLAELAGLWVELGGDRRVAGVECFGECDERVAPLVELRGKTVHLHARGLGQNAGDGLVSRDAFGVSG